MTNNFKLKSFIVANLFFAVSACAANEESQHQLLVAPSQVDCVGMAKQKCLVINDLSSQDSTWLFHYEDIKNFTFKEGAFYQVDTTKVMRDDVAADQSNYYLKANKVRKLDATKFLDNTALLNTKWLARSINGLTTDHIKQLSPHPFIQFSNDDLIGNAGCHQFWSNNIHVYEADNLNNAYFNLDSIATVRMACMTKAGQISQQRMFSMLKSANQLKVEWPYLHFYLHGRITATFIAMNSAKIRG